MAHLEARVPWGMQCEIERLAMGDPFDNFLSYSGTEKNAVHVGSLRNPRSEPVWTQRTLLSRLEGRMGPRAIWSLSRPLLAAKESSIFEVPGAMRAFRASLSATWAEVSRLNLLELAPALRVPVYFFLGRNDHWVPPEVSVAYFDALSAPSKKLVWFERSGHEPFMDEAAEFNAAMAELVRPALIPHP